METDSAPKFGDCVQEILLRRSDARASRSTGAFTYSVKNSRDARRASASYADTDIGEGSVEADIFGFARLDAAVHGMEEQIGTITETDLRVRIAERKPREAADIGNDDGSRADEIRVRMADGFARRIVRAHILRGVIGPRGLIMHMRTLPPEQHSAVQSPIERKVAVLPIV